ncbi:MAG TPA: hypothetical protein VEK15_05935, partial [Vicinamibacteria bacterium]|nr:hypothetical protein [Vicinamibacteria bacterium]
MLDREDVRKSGQNANDLGVRLGRSGGSYWSGRAKVHRLGEDQFARLNAKAQRRLARAMSRLQEATRRLEDSTQRLAD